MKKLIKNNVIKFINAPEKDILSSQTLYEALLTALDMYESCTNENDKKFWENESFKLANLIKNTQLPNGGFDLGYNFVFGKGLEKTYSKEATTPEVLSVYALYRYTETFGLEKSSFISANIENGVKWILNNIIAIDNYYAIPYAPHTYDKVHITNGVSFAIGALAYYVRDNKKDERAVEVFNGMIEFMYDQLENSVSGSGSYWPYFYQNGSEKEKELINDKVDNYHIAQQLKYHCAAYKLVPTAKNLEIIKLVSDYLFSKIDNNMFIPYTENGNKKSSKIDMWGYTSIIKAFIEVNHILKEEKYTIISKKIVKKVINHSWNGEYFYPILDDRFRAFDKHFYPRSDAWVLHSLAHYYKNIERDEEIYKVIFKGYTSISEVNFIGYENHTLSRRKKVFIKLLSGIKRGKK